MKQRRKTSINIISKISSLEDYSSSKTQLVSGFRKYCSPSLPRSEAFRYIENVTNILLNNFCVNYSRPSIIAPVARAGAAMWPSALQFLSTQSRYL